MLESMIVINSAGGACYPLLALNLHIYDYWQLPGMLFGKAYLEIYRKVTAGKEAVRKTLILKVPFPQ